MLSIRPLEATKARSVKYFAVDQRDTNFGKYLLLRDIQEVVLIYRLADGGTRESRS